MNELHRDYFGPGVSDPLAPVQLQVVDRATHEALERLTAAGLISVTARANRPLFPEPETGSSPPPLSAAERARAEGHRALATRKLRMAQLLGGGGMADETRAPLLDAALSLGRALAVEARVPEPSALADTLLPPLSHAWKEALLPLRQFQIDASSDWQPASHALATRLTG